MELSVSFENTAAAGLVQIAPPIRGHQRWVQSSGFGHSVTGTGE
jgi:hypothetical protein